VDDNNEKALDFYAQNVNGAGEVVERIRQLKLEKNPDMEEYEKSRLLEKRREELAKYSKTGLENELKTVGALLELLHSEIPEEKQEERQGLIYKMKSLLFGE
jgi:hypothetical protein